MDQSITGVLAVELDSSCPFLRERRRGGAACVFTSAPLDGDHSLTNMLAAKLRGVGAFFSVRTEGDAVCLAAPPVFSMTCAKFRGHRAVLAVTSRGGATWLPIHPHVYVNHATFRVLLAVDLLGSPLDGGRLEQSWWAHLLMLCTSTIPSFMCLAHNSFFLLPIAPNVGCFRQPP